MVSLYMERTGSWRGVGRATRWGTPQRKFPMAIGRLREKTESEGKKFEEE